jgi:hypothetical protein
MDCFEGRLVQDLKLTVHDAPIPVTRQPSAIRGLQGAGLIATKNVVPESSTAGLELVSVPITPEERC